MEAIEDDFFGDLERALDAAAGAVSRAEALLIGAGAGLGVDSGLPDYRGERGLWRSRSPDAGMAYEDLANPKCLVDDPELAWGFYGQRLQAYREAEPHAGFSILRSWAEERDSFVFTSNIDDHFARSGFDGDRIVECHGCLEFFQCAERCTIDIWRAGDLELEIGEDGRARRPLPSCPRCGGLARPNVLMFDDGEWNWERTRRQELRYHSWLDSLGDRSLLVIELGAGTGVPAVREVCEGIGDQLIRINTREPEAPPGSIVIRFGALAALREIAARQ